MDAAADPDLRARIAVVTGGGSGVGASIAAALARRGVAVALVARGRARLERAVSAIAGDGGKAVAVAADLTDAAAVDGARARIARELGDPDILVNAAGSFGPIALLADTDPAEWQRTIDTNLIAPYLTCRAFLPAMLRRGWGRIVNVGSAASLHRPGTLTSAYAVSKSGLDRLTRQLAAEIDGHGVTANVIHPGELKSDMWQDISDRAGALGAEGAGLRQWVEMVGRTGGDDPAKAAALVLRIVADASVNGRFLWIEDGMQAPVSSWDEDPAPAWHTDPSSARSR